LGVRLRYEPKVIEDFYKEYLTAIRAAQETLHAAQEKKGDGNKYQLTLWPKSMREYLDRCLKTTFTVRSYLLDPTKCEGPVHGIAKPQPLPTGSEPVDGNPLDGLIRIHEIEAQRGLGEPGGSQIDANGASRARRKLSEQLRSYYSKHLDPCDSPEPADLDALEAIEAAQKLFDDRLTAGFSAAIEELESLNYPGVTDPKLKIATKVSPTESLKHDAAVQYEVISDNGEVGASSLLLPEEYNGLGYQNLISMVFKLMSFRDAWMRVGKADKTSSTEAKKQHLLPPLHLVLVEEPEAHLHAQVQQVFVRQAYKVLRNHPNLRESQVLQTQLIVSTHSSHVAHETDFANLRYFRRLPATAEECVPRSAVINLSEVFGPNDETAKFVTRYLRATHCDLFFADAAILVEGPAERMLVPHFIREHFPKLRTCYVALLEIGGSHAHRLQPLIEHLGLTTLLITDLDSVEATGHHKAAPPQRDSKQLTGNATLKQWHPQLNSIDELLNCTDAAKTKTYEIPLFAVRVAYQTPVTLQPAPETPPIEALATTLEDSLVFENLSLFNSIHANSGMIADFATAINKCADPGQLGKTCFDIVRKGDKAAFALDLLWLEKSSTSKDDATPVLEELRVPKYIKDGLSWLDDQLRRKHDEVLASEAVTSSPEANP
jgi:predicted ATP-dependent endonuclease of OLD family